MDRFIRQRCPRGRLVGRQIPVGLGILRSTGSILNGQAENQQERRSGNALRSASSSATMHYCIVWAPFGLARNVRLFQGTIANPWGFFHRFNFLMAHLDFTCVSYFLTPRTRYPAALRQGIECWKQHLASPLRLQQDQLYAQVASVSHLRHATTMTKSTTIRCPQTRARNEENGQRLFIPYGQPFTPLLGQVFGEPLPRRR